MEIGTPYITTIAKLGDKRYKIDWFGNHLGIWLNIEWADRCRIVSDKVQFFIEVIKGTPIFVLPRYILKTTLTMSDHMGYQKLVSVLTKPL